jgi:hypothetical protein
MRDDALAVGAVTKTDELAFFSSRGPRVGDSALKPEITAPGVDIVAARGKDSWIGAPAGPDGKYMTLSGTSMATPHVAGSAAILAADHPDWKSAQLKAALMGAAKPIPAIGVYAQGAGRVDIARAVRQTVTTSPASVSFGLQRWPHSDDTVIARNVTYHNQGTSAVTLNLTLNTKGPDGKPAPAGLFALSAPTVTVPAGGDAEVTVTADTRVAGPDGYAGGDLTATAGDLVVQTPLAVDKEVESYDLTLTHLDRAGKTTDQYDTLLIGMDRPVFHPVYDPSGTAKVRLPKGRYLLVTIAFAGDRDHPELTQLVQPGLQVDSDQIITMDARAGKPVSVQTPDFTFGFSLLSRDFNALYAAQVGGAGKVEGLVSQVGGQWGRLDANGRLLNSPYAYLLNWFQRGLFPTGFSRRVTDRELAKVRADLAEEATGAQGQKVGFARLPGDNGGSWAAGFPYDLPNTRTEYYNTDDGVERSSLFLQMTPSTDPNFPFPRPISENDSPWTAYRAGRAYQENWNQGVFGPALPPTGGPYEWASRARDEMSIGVPIYGDGAGRAGFSETATATITVDRDGTRVGEAPRLVGRSRFRPAPGGTASRSRPPVARRSTCPPATVWCGRSGPATSTGTSGSPCRCR